MSQSAADVLRYANRIDPGTVTFAPDTVTLRHQQKIAAHYEAVGMRTALLMLGYNLVQLRDET